MDQDSNPGVGEREATAFLDVALPHWTARGLAYLLILLFAAASAASVVIHIPETVSSPFVLVPLHGTDPVRASRNGIVATVRVTEGQPVLKGDAMFVIQSPPVGDRSAELRTLEARLIGAREGLANARKKYESQRLADDEEGRRLNERLANLTQKVEQHRIIEVIRQTKYEATLDIYRNEVEIAKNEIEFKKTQFALAKEVADRFEKFQKEGVISWLEYSYRKLEATKLAVDLQQLERQLDTARLKVSQLKAEHENQKVDSRLTMNQLETERKEVSAAIEKLRHELDARRAEYQELERGHREDMEKAEIRIAALAKELSHSRGNEVSVPAPCSGTVIRLSVRGPGAVVHDGEILCELACSGERLQAELTVPQSGVGLIKPGHRVKLLYDAFPYQRHGIKYGAVRWISPAGVMVKDTPVFRALVDLEDDAVLVKGQPRPLMAGMGGRADVLVGRRSLISHAFEPIRQLRENLAETRAK